MIAFILTSFGASQAKGLYVFDPKALNHIIVKDQMVYEEPRWFIRYSIIPIAI